MPVTDRVCSLVFEAFKTFARVSATMIQKIPDDISFPPGGGIARRMCYGVLCSLGHRKDE